MSLDITSMLQDLLETEAQLEKQKQIDSESNIQPLTKSVSFRGDDDAIRETRTYEEDEPILDGTKTRVAKVDEPKSILKAPSVDVLPTEIPLEPMDYESVSEDSDSDVSEESDESLDFHSDDENQADEDIEFDEEGDMFHDQNDQSSVYEKTILNIESKKIDEILDVLDEFIMHHQSQTSPTIEKTESMALSSAPVVTDLKPIAYEGAPDDGEKNVSFYGQQVPVEPLPRRVSLPSILKPERLSSLPSMERIDEMKKSASRSSEKPLSEQRQQEQKQTEKVLDKIERSLERKIVEDDVKDLKKVLIINKITTRVYIEDARQFKTKVLTSLMTAKQVVEDVSLGLSGQSWALFELCNDFGIERPLRDWEIVTDMLSAWDEGSSNAIVLKKYGYKATLSPSYIRGRYPRIQGYLFVELKPGKWFKRFCVLKEYILFYYKEGNNSASETVLCNLSQFDIYTMTKPRKKAPTDYSFAIRSDMNLSFFDDKTEYVHYFCVEKPERLLDWVLALRMAKSERMYQGPKPKEREPLVQTAKPSKMQPGSLLATDPPVEKLRKKKVKPEQEGEKKKKSSKKPKPLIDLTTANNCKSCGCSEFVQYPKRDACPSCYHVHRPRTTT